MFDFVILTVPRTGSYMLASALNAHSELRCGGELGMIEKFRMPDTGGDKSGCIIQSYHLRKHEGILNRVPKVLLLLRDAHDIADSLNTNSETGMNYSHYLEPKIIENREIFTRRTVEEIQQSLDAVTAFAATRNVLRLEYNDLTGDEDVRELNRSEMICDYLEVSHEPLRPQTYRPAYLE